MPADSPAPEPSPSPRWCFPATLLAAVVGVALLAHTASSISATYDEPTYLRIAARWYLTGEQSRIARMGTPLTFWKLQQGPALWLLDHLGERRLILDPDAHQPGLLPYARLGSIPLWVVALALTALWARLLYGPRAMAYAAWSFALSPNLLAHGALATMETPLVATSTGAFLLFWCHLRYGRPAYFWASAACAGLAFSCKFTAVLIPALVVIVWAIDLLRDRRTSYLHVAWTLARGLAGYLAVMALADLFVTGFAFLPLSPRAGLDHPTFSGPLARWPALGRLATRLIETPIPQDLAGFLTQLRYQQTGGPSYLLGQRRMFGWWYYYLVALAVKVPLAVLAASLVRAFLKPRPTEDRRDFFLPTIIAAFLAITALGSSRNYGLRYLLPLAPLAIAWTSLLAERRGLLRAFAVVVLAAQAWAVASVHPNELTYFNAPAGGPLGGRRILADSNLDWGQGFLALARLQKQHPEYADMTLYAFGDVPHPRYGVSGSIYVLDANGMNENLPSTFRATTLYVAVSSSLQWGPWGPDRYFDALKGREPVALTDDSTIAIYRSADVFPRGDDAH